MPKRDSKIVDNKLMFMNLKYYLHIETINTSNVHLKIKYKMKFIAF